MQNFQISKEKPAFHTSVMLKLGLFENSEEDNKQTLAGLTGLIFTSRIVVLVALMEDEVWDGVSVGIGCI